MTCAPNHPKGILYPGYVNNLFQWDNKNGIRILRVKTYLSPNKGFLKRTLNYFSYMISSTMMCFMVKRIDIVVSTSPQFFCGMAGLWVSRIKQCPWVLEIRDLWPESIIAVGAIRQMWVIRLLERLETVLYKKADHIVSLTRAFKYHIMNRGVAAKKITIITNGADLDQFKPLPKENAFRLQHKLEGKFVVSYVGTFGMAHRLETVLKAAHRLNGDDDVVFVLVGDGAEREKLIRQVKSMNLFNLIMLSQQPKEKIPQIIAASDACMVLLKKNDLFKTVIPSKIFEAMAMERPVILGVEGESKDIIEKANCGLCIEPENDEQLAEAVLRLHNNPELSERLGRNGRQFVKKYFDRDKLAETYLGVLQKML